MNNITSYDSLLKLINKQTNSKVLLHSCCAPCSSHCINLLKEGFKLDIFYSNSNIDKETEFNKRCLEQQRLLNIISFDSKLIIDKYDPSEFDNAVKGLEHLKEKSIRCYNCYLMRMEKTCKYAKEHNYDYWTTTLSISPHKNSNWINEIGEKLAIKYQMPFLYSNFKLKDGYKDSIVLSKEYDLYRQNYCGCKYSKIERGILDE